MRFHKNVPLEHREILTEQLKKYFPKDYTVEKMKREIIDILKIWMDKYWDL